MIYSYKKMYNKNYLILDQFDEPLNNDYRIEMLKRNSIEGLMDMQVFTDDNMPSFHYDITGKFSFHSYYFENRIQHSTIVNFFTSLQNTLLNLHKYLLDYDHLILTPQCVFFDKNQENFYFSYCPSYKADFFASLKDFIAYILTITDHNDERTVLTSYALWQESSNENFNIQSLMNIFEKQSIPKPITEVVPEVVPESSNILKEPDVLLKENYTYEPSFIIKNVAIFGVAIFIFIGNIIMRLAAFYSMEMFFIILMAIVVFTIFHASSIVREAPLHRVYEKITEPEPEKVIHIDTTIVRPQDSFETTSFNEVDDQATVLLCVNPKLQTRHLIYTGLDFSQEVNLENYPFNVGKADDNHLFINHPAVSRHHCRITFNNDEYFIEDLNSSNGTKINDEVLPAYTPTALSIGDSITFAHLTYIFQ